MSIASRQRQVVRDARLCRTKPAYNPRPVHNEYEPSPFDVTALQDHAHKSAVADSAKIRQKKAGKIGAFKHWLAAYSNRVQFWPAWKRDGHESEVHYAVKHNLHGLWFALREGGETHPLFSTATKALELGLIKL